MYEFSLYCCAIISKTIWLSVLLHAIPMVRANSHARQLTNCDPSSHELPKIYPVLPLHSAGQSEQPSDIFNTTSQNSSRLSWSSLIYQKCKVRVEFICNASYPIEWVEHYNQNIEILTDTKNYIRKDLWTDRIINETLLEITDIYNHNNNDLLNIAALTSYTAFLGVNYGGNVICAAANYTCQSVSDPCLQSNVVSIVDHKNETIRYENSSVRFDYSTDFNSVNRTCKTIIDVAIIKQRGRVGVGWKCKSPQKNQHLTVFSRTCDAAVHCNSYFSHYTQSGCVNRLADDEECKECSFKYKTTGYLRHPGFIWCGDEEGNILTAVQYFFSIPQSVGKQDMPELYLHWDEADPQKMLHLEPLPNEIYFGERKHIICKISRYYFSFGHRFGFEYVNGTFEYTRSIDGEHDLSQNVNRMNITMAFLDRTLKRVYCFAPVWNSTVWVNQSLEINIRDDGAPPTFNGMGKDKGSSLEEKITFDLHQRNATLPCMAVGRPVPQIAWTFDNRDVGSREVQVEEGKKDLVFQYVTQSIQGKYKCEATNFLGTATKVVVVSVRDELSDYIRTTTIVATIALLIFTVLLGFCWIKVRRQRNQIRALTDAEVTEFREGNLEVFENSEYLDTQELLHALPYNDEYEIPSKCLYVDPSEVLGSGNFGQVLKGAVFDRHDKRKSSVVAVKTTKPRHEVAYFQTLLTEVKIMAYTGHHTNIVSLIGACTENIKNCQIYIAVEYCAKGSLEKVLKNNRSSFVNLVCDDTIYITTSLCDNGQNHMYENIGTWSEISTVHLLKWSREVANGMDFLGSKKIVHGDLATRNILLTSDLIAKIGDFGLSRVLMTYSNYIRSTQDDCLLPWAWLAPETLNELKFSVMSDVWSYGVTLWEIFSLAQRPYAGLTYNSAFLDWLQDGHRLNKPSCATSQLYNLMMECWSLEPSQRITFTELKDVFEGILMQACNGDYVHTKVNGTTKYINGSHNLRVQNPGYTVLGQGNIFNGDDEDSNTLPSLTDDNISVQVITTAEDYQGYLKPLMIDFEKMT